MILIFIFDQHNFAMSAHVGIESGVHGNTDGKQVQSKYPALWSIDVWLFQPLLLG
jgi:hypothetical protein